MCNPWTVAAVVILVTSAFVAVTAVVIPLMSARVAMIATFPQMSARAAYFVTAARKIAGVAGHAEKRGKCPVASFTKTI